MKNVTIYYEKMQTYATSEATLQLRPRNIVPKVPSAYISSDENTSAMHGIVGTDPNRQGPKRLTQKFEKVMVATIHRQWIHSYQDMCVIHLEFKWDRVISSEFERI